MHGADFQAPGLRFDEALGFKLMHGLGLLGYGASGLTAFEGSGV